MEWSDISELGLAWAGKEVEYPGLTWVRLDKKSCIWELLKLSTCSDSSTDKKDREKILSCVMCWLSCFMCPVLYTTCHVHLSPATNSKKFKNPKMFKTSNTEKGILSFEILLFTKSLQSSDQKSPVYPVLGPTGGDNQTNTQTCRHRNLLTESPWRLIHGK